MSKVAISNACIPSMTNKELAIAEEAEKIVWELDKIVCATHHTIHDGIYSRTLFMPKDTIVAGVIIKVPTTLVLSGKMSVLVGDKVHHINGYAVIPTMGNRKQVVHAWEDSYATLLFKTDAKTIEEAEKQMTDEYERLMSHNDESINTINITGV